jgi:hypothetical protein
MTAEKVAVKLPESVKPVEKDYEDLQLAQDKREIEELISDFITFFPYAMNFGRERYISDYIDPESPLYDELFDFIFYACQHNIWEELEDYRIVSIEPAGEGQFHVVCEERFTTYNNGHSMGTTNVFKNTYTVRKKANGKYHITAVDFLNLLNRI